MKQRVVFLFYHGLSHVIAILELARILERNGYDVYFAGAEFFHQYVLSQGFKFKRLKSVPFGLGFEKWVRTIEKEKYIYWSLYEIGSPIGCTRSAKLNSIGCWKRYDLILSS
jgi:hypothetical protein